MKVNEITLSWDNGDLFRANLQEDGTWTISDDSARMSRTDDPTGETSHDLMRDERDLLFEIACELGVSQGSVTQR